MSDHAAAIEQLIGPLRDRLAVDPRRRLAHRVGVQLDTAGRALVDSIEMARTLLDEVTTEELPGD